MGFADDAKKKLEDAVDKFGDKGTGESTGDTAEAGGETSRPTGPTGPEDPAQPTKSTEPTAPTGPMGSGVPGGGADRSDDPISKPENDGDSDPVPTDPSPVPPEPGADPNEDQPRRMHNMRGLDDPEQSDG